MYGTVSEICITLLERHKTNEKIAVITWTAEDVREKPMPQAAGLPPAAALTRRRLPSG